MKTVTFKFKRIVLNSCGNSIQEAQGSFTFNAVEGAEAFANSLRTLGGYFDVKIV